MSSFEILLVYLGLGYFALFRPSLTPPLNDVRITGYNDRYDDALLICEQVPDEGSQWVT